MLRATSIVIVLCCATPRVHAESPRVFHTPTAWLQPAGSLHGSAGVNHHGGGLFAITAGLGGLADVDVNISDRFLVCDVCDGADRSVRHALVGSALFKIGVGNGNLWDAPFALALGFRKSVAARDRGARLAELFLAVSARIGFVDLHGGAELWDADDSDGRRLDRSPGNAVRPFVGLEIKPPMYPRTALIGDFSWAPEFGDVIRLRWLAGWGIRYQALSWGSIELGVRHRQAEEIGDTTVFMRVNGVWKP